MAARDQLQELKINVTNIKSVLIKGREQQKKISSRKVSFIRREEKREQRIEKENALEKFRIPTFGVAGLVQSTTSGIFGGLMGFLGNILAGYIVVRLPQIIAKAQEIYENVKPIWEGAFKTLTTIFNGVGFVFSSITSVFDKGEAEKNLKKTETELKNFDKEADSDISFFSGLLKSAGIMMPETPQAPEQGSPSSIADQSGGLGMPDTPTPSPSSMPQERNRGGEVLKTTQPKRAPQRDSRSETSAARIIFPRVANKTIKNTKAYQKNVIKMGEIVKLLKMKRKTSSAGGGGIPSGPTPQRSADNAPIATGPIKPGGTLEFVGDGSGATGSLVMKDATGKKIGSWEAISGVYRTANASQSERRNVSGTLNPLPDGTYPLLGFAKHGYVDGVGSWSTYINNMAGAIGRRSQILVHNDIGSNGTAGCVGVELGGRSGTEAEKKFLAAYEATKPTSINVAIGKGNKASRPKVSADNVPIPKGANAPQVAMVIQPIVKETTKEVPVAVSSGGGQSALNSNTSNNYFDIG